MFYQFSIVTVRVITNTILNYNRLKTIIDNMFFEIAQEVYFLLLRFYYLFIKSVKC